MKNIRLYFGIFALIMLWGCSNQLKESVELNVTASTEAGTIKGNAITVKVDEPITFSFTGSPDFITFYSGEAGSEYAKRNLLESPADEITSVLKFDNMPQYGRIPNTLKLLVSTEFTGIKGAPASNKQSDSTMIVDHTWTDISDLANFSTRSNTKNDSEIPLDDYLGKKLTIAFKYDPQQNDATQPTWELTNLMIENTNKKTGAVSQILASNMGFKVLDMVSNTPYKNDGGGGVWDLRNIGPDRFIMRIQSQPAGQPINEDWLISNPILVNSRPGDAGLVIKKISIDLDSYKYSYSQPGTYIVTFVARNANYEHFSEVIKEFTVTVNE